MASVVDICNLSLSHLGDEATVSSISPPEGSAQADHCAKFYPIARDQVLVSHEWACATKRASLALLSLTPPDGWLYSYALPSGCLRAMRVVPPGSSLDNEAEDFVVEAQTDGTLVLYTNVASANLVFIAGITDTTKFTPGMVTAIARLLASYLAGPVIKGEAGIKVAQAHLSWYAKIDLPAAQAQNANARRKNPYDTFTPSSIAARQ